MNTGPDTQYGIEHIPEMVLDLDIKEVIREMQEKVLRALGLDEQTAIEVTSICLDLAKTCETATKYEHLAHHVLRRGGALNEVPYKLIERAEQICNQIQSYLLYPGKTLDYGCGDGEVGKILSGRGFPVHLADVKTEPKCGLPFESLNNGDPLPYEDDQFHNTLLLTVLHHSNHPDRLLREARRVTKHKGKIIVIESIVDINNDKIPAMQKRRNKSFFTLNENQQRLVSIYFDHLFNRVLHYSDDPEKKINVPCNFDSSEGWKERFEKTGLIQKKIIHLGFDQSPVPEYHTLHVLEVDKNGDEGATAEA
jgi:SAM-dependent methyltransferase